MTQQSNLASGNHETNRISEDWRTGESPVRVCLYKSWRYWKWEKCPTSCVCVLQRYPAEVTDLISEGEIGSGTCGQVFKVRFKKTCHVIAVKVSSALCFKNSNNCHLCCHCAKAKRNSRFLDDGVCISMCLTSWTFLVITESLKQQFRQE